MTGFLLSVFCKRTLALFNREVAFKGNFVEDKNTSETILCQNKDDRHYHILVSSFLKSYKHAKITNIECI